MPGGAISDVFEGVDGHRMLILAPAANQQGGIGRWHKGVPARALVEDLIQQRPPCSVYGISF